MWCSHRGKTEFPRLVWTVAHDQCLPSSGILSVASRRAFVEVVTLAVVWSAEPVWAGYARTAELTL